MAKNHHSKASDRAKETKSQEDRVAGILGGKRLKASGALPTSRRQVQFAPFGIPLLTDDHRPGEVVLSRKKIVTAKADISTDRFMVEHKRTEKGSMQLQQSWLEKVEEGAAQVGKTPLVVITFEPNDDWALVPLSFLTGKYSD